MLTRSTARLAALFAVSGVLHFATPRPYEAIVPKLLPRKRELVYASGVAELLCAAGLLHPRTRPLAGRASAVLLTAIFPANVQMALDLRGPAKVAGLARLPLQIPLIRAALRAARE